MTRPSPFRKSDVTKALKAASAGGFVAARVELAPDGRIVLVAGGHEREPVNPWDAVTKELKQ
jgi:hypothetical protein